MLTYLRCESLTTVAKKVKLDVVSALLPLGEILQNVIREAQPALSP